MTVVDSHTHVWQAVVDAPDPAATIVSPASDVPEWVLREHLEEHGVDRAVLVQPLCAGLDNELVTSLARADPDRYAAVCAVDPRGPDVADELARWAEGGCRGVRLRPYAVARDSEPAAPALRPFWEAVRALGLVVNLYCGEDDLPAIGTVAGDYPEIPLIVDHLAHADTGATDPAAPLRALAAHARVYLKLSGYHHFARRPYPYPDAVELVRSLHGSFGGERMLFGSDFPHVLLRCGYARSVALPGRAFDFLAPSELAAVLGGTANALYFEAAGG